MNYLRRSLVFALLLVSFLSAAVRWDFLDVTSMGAQQFIKAHPSYNGKGVVIIILDTGVDMGTPGLKTLPDGGVKVIDAQDFSGEGDVSLEKAAKGVEGKEKYLKNPDGLRLYGYDRLKYTAKDSLYYIGVLKEERFMNSSIPDVNNNGKKNDQFGVIVFNTADGWLAYVDLDGDGNLSDEQPLWNYKKKRQSFQFRGRNPKDHRSLATFALNIFPEEKRVNFHYDGSSHGTHVAGIAAGYQIDGQKGFNGIAPGAQIISLKIGDSRLAGGATTTGSMLSAYEYGIKFAKEYGGPVVFNMSFGIGSEIEGQSDMDLTLNDLLAENEKLLFCISAGNEGPGISTIGLPAAAKRVLTVGALNSKATARDLYGADMKEDKIFAFSSRGGELNKPDIITPGGASSTVPEFSSRDIKWGTSMASPEAAGAVALLMSAANQQKPPLAINGAILKKAIKNAADPLPGYLPLDQGSGVINIPRAFSFYQKYITAKEQKKILDYEISTLSPVYESENGEAAYWRFGDYAPDKNKKQRFYIDPVFPDTLNADQRNAFYRAFDLKSGAPWIRLNKSSAYIKGEKPALVDVYFDKKKMKNPGLYNGKVIAYRKGNDRASGKEFELMCTVVKPLLFSERNKFSWSSPPMRIRPGDLKRLFFDIPLKATAATIKIAIPRSEYGNIRGYLYEPAGRESEHYIRLYSKRFPEQTVRMKTQEMQRGSWELDLYADFRSEQTSVVRVKIDFSALETEPDVVTKVKVNKDGRASGHFTVRNQYDTKISCTINGAVNGLQKITQIKDDSDNYQYNFHVGDQIKKVTFDLEMKPEIFNYFTDFAVNVKDYSGKALVAEGFTYRKLTINFFPKSSGDYYLELIPAFAEHEPKSWQLRLKESDYYFNPIPISGSESSYFPRLKRQSAFTINGVLPVVADGYYLFGEIDLNSKDVNHFKTIIPLQLHTGIQK